MEEHSNVGFTHEGVDYHSRSPRSNGRALQHSDSSLMAAAGNVAVLAQMEEHSNLVHYLQHPFDSMSQSSLKWKSTPTLRLHSIFVRFRKSRSPRSNGRALQHSRTNQHSTRMDVAVLAQMEEHSNPEKGHTGRTYRCRSPRSNGRALQPNIYNTHFFHKCRSPRSNGRALQPCPQEHAVYHIDTKINKQHVFKSAHCDRFLQKKNVRWVG